MYGNWIAWILRTPDRCPISFLLLVVVLLPFGEWEISGNLTCYPYFDHKNGPNKTAAYFICGNYIYLTCSATIHLVSNKAKSRNSSKLKREATATPFQLSLYKVAIHPQTTWPRRPVTKLDKIFRENFNYNH